MSIKIGEYNLLKVLRVVDFGVYLDDEKKGILLPSQWVPENISVGDEINVFLCHDSENRIIATTIEPLAVVGEIAFLKVKTVTPIGAFLDLGLMKDLFVPRSQQKVEMIVGGSYFVYIYVDELTNRMVGTELFENNLKSAPIEFKELDEVSLAIYRKTELGYVVIINNSNIGLLHANEVFKPLTIGEKHAGFIKKINAETNKIDVLIGKPGYGRVEDESEKILRLLKEKKGKLPYNDKTQPGEIYSYFGMSKKTFKMTIGNLYKQKQILITEDGIELVNTELIREKRRKMI